MAKEYQDPADSPLPSVEYEMAYTYPPPPEDELSHRRQHLLGPVVEGEAEAGDAIRLGAELAADEHEREDEEADVVYRQ
ncbi:Uu.00g055380.m01.CDS01 [Anthostomella pinea]|uniref:Uu.00g055380.m01.CDS01 n=1 Tax=Anthostomella pinea TaxID=933095 RepID=A0AAI8VY19_9PEZI|nr:Uu.00g055380.m01.CDS01 [Anthostomella pinea]